MNIKDAGVLLAKGFLMRRVSWAYGKHAGLDEIGIYIRLGKSGLYPTIHFQLLIEDILAEDWEIHTPPPLSSGSIEAAKQLAPKRLPLSLKKVKK